MTPDPSAPQDAPPELIKWMERFGGSVGDAEPEALAKEALRALEAALSQPGRNRDAAFALLAADGLMTRAVEQLALAADPEAGLRALIESMRSGSVGGRE